MGVLYAVHFKYFISCPEVTINLLFTCTEHGSKKMEVETVQNTETAPVAQNTEAGAQNTEAGAQTGKKRKLNKYFRVHAHRNPLSDGDYDQYIVVGPPHTYNL